jgi:hypothetical protein
MSSGHSRYPLRYRQQPVLMHLSSRERLMPVKVIYKKRADVDRRKTFSTYYDTERRSGVDRRKLDEKLKRLTETNTKDQNEKKKPVHQKSGNVILRRKAEKD